MHITNMHITNRAITSTRVVETLLAGLLVVALVGFGAGCDTGGSNGDGDGDDDGGEEDTTAPAVPSGLTGESGNSAVDLTWGAVDAEDLSGYNVYRSTESIGGDVGGLDPENGSPLSETSYTDEAAENGTTYHYVVTAVDTASNGSGPSGEVEKTPFDSPPDRP